MTQRVYVDRSRYETAQACARRRWLEYHEGGRGITSARKPLPLAVGGAVHEGLAMLLRQGQIAWDGGPETFNANWRVVEEAAVAAALADFAQFDGGRIALEPTEAPAADAPMVTDYDRYLYAEQSALVEAIVRAYARRRLRPLLEQFTVLEVEREGEWLLSSSGSDIPYANACSGADYHLPSCGGTCGELSEGIDEIWFMSRPDALLLERSSGQLYLQSFKTTSGWDVRRARDAEHDMQGLSEGVEVERRLALIHEWYYSPEMGKISLPEAPPEMQRAMGGTLNRALCDFVMASPAPPRILGIRYEYLLKGERWRDKGLAARFGFDARAQRSPLVRGYLNAGMAAGDEQWNWSYDYMKDDGSLSKLYAKNWPSRPVWEHMSIAQWITKLDETAMAVNGETGTEMGYKSDAQATGFTSDHPLDSVFLAPIVNYRNDDDLRDMVEQMEANERRVAEGVAAVNAAADEGEKRSRLNQFFPQTRRACEFPTQCPYVKICYGGEDIRRAPLDSGLYRIRVPNHPQEANGNA